MRITRLPPSQSVTVRHTTLAYQGDGNLVLYRHGEPVWASMAFGEPGVCQMQPDGNLVCYDRASTPYWHSGTHGYPGATCVLQDDGNLVIYTASGDPIWATGTAWVDPAPPSSRWQIYANFLANGIERWGFMVLGWRQHDRTRYERFLRAYAAAGYRHLPCALWGAYPGESWYDYRPDLRAAVAAFDEMRALGIQPIIFGLTDDHEPSSAAEQIQRLEQVLTALARLTDLAAYEWCLGWELNQVAGWREDSHPRQGHDMIALARMMRRVTGRAPWLHLQPNWWAPHYEGGDEDDWWRDVGDDCCGLLAQIRPDAPLDRTGDPAAPDGLYLMLEYPRHTDGARGIAGRLVARGKHFVLFEHSRDLARWQRVLDRIQDDPRVVGIG